MLEYVPFYANNHHSYSVDGPIDYARCGSNHLSWIPKDLMPLRRRAQDEMVRYLDFQQIINLQTNELIIHLFIICFCYIISKAICSNLKLYT